MEDTGNAAEIIAGKLDAGTIVFDFSGGLMEGKICVFMRRGASYSYDNVKFTKEHPFQMIEEAAARHLISSQPDKFEEATRDQVRDFYNKSSKTGPQRMRMV